MRRIGFGFLGFLLLATSPVFAGKPTGPLAGFGNSREWSDDSGRFKITGQMVEANAKTVQLKKSDGRVVSVPVDKLGSSDRAYVEAFLAAEAAMPQASDAENPFAGGVLMEDSAAGQPSPSASTNPTPTGSLDDIQMREMDDRSAINVSIEQGSAFWEAGEVSARNIPELRDRSVNLPMPKEFFASVQMNIAGGQPAAYFSVYRQGRSEKENYSRLGKYAVASRDGLALGQSEKPWKIMAVSSDGSLLALVRVEGFDKGNDIAIVKVKDDVASAIYQFKAGGGSFAEIRWAGFLANDRLATIDQKHNLAVWNLRDATISHRGVVGNQTMSAVIGGNGQLLAIPGTGSVAFLNAKTMKQVGTIQLENPVKCSLAFSNDGKFVATFTPYVVEVFSLKDGQRKKRIAVSNNRIDTPLAWVGNNIFLDRSLLIDVENERPWWRYDTGRGPVKVHGNMIFSLFPDKKASTLVMTNVPHDSARRALQDADSADLLALQAGSEVSLNLNLSGLNPDQQSTVRQALEEKIANNEWKLVSNSRNEINVEIKQGKNENEDYVETRGFGPPPPFSRFHSGPTTTVNFRPWHHSLKMTVDGKEVFSAQKTVGAPGYLPNEKGKSTQQQVNERVKPSPDFFKTLRLPREVVRPEYRDGFGKSTITAGGLR